MEITVVGDGVFGTFLRQELAVFANIIPHFKSPCYSSADIIILAVPLRAYENVASIYQDRHLVNVCSVQEESTDICRRYSDRVTSIHPMFGPRSPKEGRTCIATSYLIKDLPEYSLKGYSQPIFDLFKSIGCEIITHLPDNTRIAPKIHDLMMAKTHLKVVQISELIKGMVKDAEDIPDNCLPTSFKRLKEMSEQFLDMSPGTLESIKANKY